MANLSKPIVAIVLLATLTGCGYAGGGGGYVFVASDDTVDDGGNNTTGGDVAITGDAVVNGGDAVDANDTDAPVGSVCGNGSCEAGESTGNCPKDCKAGGQVCGDGLCGAGESPDNCPGDCKLPVGPWISCVSASCVSQWSACTKIAACTGAASCVEDCDGSAACVQACYENAPSAGQKALATLVACAQESECSDSPASQCGNGACESGESSGNCPQDCGAPTKCGNGSCENGETAQSCPADCKATTKCGNGACEVGETTQSCPADCPPSANCVEAKCGAEITACDNDTKCIAFFLYYEIIGCGDAAGCKDSACYTANCNAEIGECQNHDGCTTALTCLGNCPSGDQTCATACFGAGIAKYEAFITCAQDKCP